MGGVCAVVLKAAAEVEEEVGICRALPLYSRGVSVAGVPFGAVPGVRANGRNGWPVLTLDPVSVGVNPPRQHHSTSSSFVREQGNVGGTGTDTQ
jgi:hypothetical protein